MDELRSDPALRELIDEHGPLEVEPADGTFERFVTSIVNQQLSSESAAAIRGRLFERFEIAPGAILRADPEALRETGLSEQKVEYVRNVARAFEEEGYSREYFADMTDEAVMEELTEIRGVGDWTAKMFLIFCLGREDVFPVEDLGVRRGMEALYGEMSRAEMAEKAEEWRPYRSYAARYLWRAADG